jgi:rubrerythrin
MKSKKSSKKISKKLPKPAAKKKTRKTITGRKAIRAGKVAKKVRKPSKATSRPRPFSKPAAPIPAAPTTATVPASEASPPASISVREALEIALNFEHKVSDHYARGAEVIKDPQGGRVFAALAKEEQSHIDYLESRLSEWTTRGAIDPIKIISRLPTPEWLHEVELKHRQTATAPRVADQNEVELLKTALILERETSAFYHDLVQRLSAVDRGMFEQFLIIEDGHLALVQAELDAVQGWGYWFDVQEFKLEAQ